MSACAGSAGRRSNFAEMILADARASLRKNAARNSRYSRGCENSSSRTPPVSGADRARKRSLRAILGALVVLADGLAPLAEAGAGEKIFKFLRRLKLLRLE